MIVSLDEFKAYRGSTGTGDDALFVQCLNQAQQEVENYCGRTFESSTGTRYYREDDLKNLPGIGGSGNVLWLGRDLLSVSTLTNGDETAFTSTEYWLEPRNSTTCYQYIRLRTGQSWIFETDGEISVAGTWGYSTAPDEAIKGAVKEMAGYLYEARRANLYDVTADLGAGIVTIPKGIPAHLKLVLDRGGYKRGFGPW